MIRRLLVLTTAALLITTLLPVPIQATPTTASTPPDWPDGTFQGTWQSRTASGDLHGTLDQGRRDTLGTFSVEWTTDNTTEHLTGSYLGRLFFGTNDNRTQTVIGRITTTATGFTGRLLLQSEGLIRITGHYQASFLPALTGPSKIGVQSFQIVDPDRPEYFTPDPMDVREFMVNLWYPLDPNATGTPCLYMDPPTFLWLKNQSPIPLISIPNTAYTFVHPHGQQDALVAPGLHPILVFSPGYDGVYQIYTSLIEDLASHGFVVAAINHPYVSGITVFPDGHAIGIATPPPTPSNAQPS